MGRGATWDSTPWGSLHLAAVSVPFHTPSHTHSHAHTRTHTDTQTHVHARTPRSTPRSTLDLAALPNPRPFRSHLLLTVADRAEVNQTGALLDSFKEAPVLPSFYCSINHRNPRLSLEHFAPSSAPSTQHWSATLFRAAILAKVQPATCPEASCHCRHGLSGPPHSPALPIGPSALSSTEECANPSLNCSPRRKLLLVALGQGPSRGHPDAFANVWIVQCRSELVLSRPEFEAISCAFPGSWPLFKRLAHPKHTASKKKILKKKDSGINKCLHSPAMWDCCT
ncbi:hypothetical protein B0H63DRAFT_232167 [Podospora didyma]|uniref:Uncharacterized protein n=1 Tax=Podospora didyma TaxID=330526 RepID=A0AAE0NBV4_9PEZI|nr:hypothetical protein B0H63DRAFT_232167 [Podospora didyma]